MAWDNFSDNGTNDQYTTVLHPNQTEGNGKDTNDLCPHQKDTIETVKMAIIFFIVGPGLFGNTMSFVILHIQHKKSIINHMLKVLAVVDNLFLLSVVIMYGIEIKTTGHVQRDGRRCLLIISRIAQHCSIWTIVIIGVIRYMAISHPFYVKSACTTKRIFTAMALVICFVIIYHIPIPLVFINRDKPPWSWPYFSEIYYGVVYHLLLIFFIPGTILFVLNIRLSCSLRKLNTDSCSETMLHSEDVTDITRVVIAIITTFLITNIPWCIVGIITAHPAFSVSLRTYHPCFYKWFLDVVLQTLMYTNSSVNFLIYFFLRKSFRNNLKTLLSKNSTSRRTSNSSCSTKTPSARTSFTKSILLKEEA